MSYNNIGLATPRGSGTSGHIQANRSSIRPRQQPREAAPDFKHSFAHRAPDQGILEHERKRKVEAQCFELQVQLEDDGVAADEIEAQVDALRKRLLAAAPSTAQGGAAIKPHERHQLAAAKQADDERMRRALGIRADHTEGAAFDRELQQRLKEERAAERERGREERARIEAQLRADREKALAARAAAGPPPGPSGPSDRAYRDLDRGGLASARLPYGGSTSGRGRSPSRERDMPPPARSARRLSLAFSQPEPEPQSEPAAPPHAEGLAFPLSFALPSFSQPQQEPAPSPRRRQSQPQPQPEPEEAQCEPAAPPAGGRGGSGRGRARRMGAQGLGRERVY